MLLSATELAVIGLSLKIATVAVLASLPFGIAMGWLLARKRFPGKALLDALVHLPLVLPPVVIGYMLLVGFGNQGVFGKAFAAVGLVIRPRNGRTRVRAPQRPIRWRYRVHT